MKKSLALTLAVGGLIALTGCKTSQQVAGGGGGGGPGVPSGTLPITAKGRVLAFRASAESETETNTLTNLPMTYTKLTGTTFLDKTGANGIGVTGTAEPDPTPNPFQGSTQNNNGVTNPPALITTTADGAMTGGTELAGLDKAKGSVFFAGGSFGNPQVSDDRVNLSTVGVYNLDGNPANQINLKHGVTVRYTDGVAGENEGNFAVGYIGENTTNMPGTGTAEYKGFWEQGVAAYDDGTQVRQMFISGDVNIMADFGAGRVSGGLRNASLETYDQVSQSTRNLNASITGLDIDATINGSEYNGSARLIDNAGNQVGTTTTSNLIGAFLGNSAVETVAATMIEGTAPLDGRDSNFILTGVMGGVKK
jgi:hypothetical protein